MKELTQLVPDRKNTDSAWFHHAVITNWDGVLSNITLLRGLEERVPVAEVQISAYLPIDL